MRFTERRLRAGVAGAGLAGLALLCGCSKPSTPAPGPMGPVASTASSSAAPSTVPTPAATAPAPERPPAPARTAPPLAPPGPVRTAAELRRQAAHRIVAANPQGTYTGAVREPLLAIPVLEVELQRDGSIARIVVLRAPRQAKDTIQLAIAAVRRAAPFGDVSQLPRPWRFTETFLFDDDRKFKPRTLDE